MPRKVRDANLETRTARSRLTARHDPYFRLIEPGLHLGYRKTKSGPGTWLVRRRVGTETDKRYSTENLRTRDGELVLADDYDDADGITILTFGQAQQQAQAKSGRKEKTRAYTVADALEDYLRRLEHEGRSEHALNDARRRVAAFVLPALGDIKLSALTTKKLRQWRDGLATAPRRVRTRKGEEQQFRERDDDEDAKRARRATANRCWTILRSALNSAFHDGECESDLIWRRIKPFRNVEAARTRYLTIAESQRLINACQPDFRRLVQGALQTGCRYGGLVKLEVRDFNSDAGTIAVQRSKREEPRYVILSDEGKAFFREITAGRAPKEKVFLRADGAPWRASQQGRPMIKACEVAGITPPISINALRHTWASLSVMAGMPDMVVAKNMGHTSTRMIQKHYAHLSPSYVSDEIRKNAPQFGFEPDKKATK